MKNSDDLSLIGKIFWNKYKIIKKIGQGSFGRIYQGINLFTEELYAIKFEDINEKSELLGKEAIFLYYLKGPGIPDILLYDTIDNYHILIESLLGKSLEVLFLESLYNFTIKDIAMIGIQILYRLEYIHNKYIIHRDIKPDNFVIGQDPNNNMIYIIDFGLAKKYRSSKTLEHIKFRLTKKLTGTTRYASVNALKGGEQSRRDDLESLAYMLFFFLRGNLPWQGAKGLTKEERYKKIYKIKKSTQPDELCLNFPEEFKFFLLYVKNLEFEEDPNYDYCRGLLENVLKKMNEKLDNNFSWCKRIGTDENKLRNQKLIVKKNLGQSIINTTGQTQKSAAVSNLISSMKSFHQNKKLINRISVILNDNKKDSLLNKFNNHYNNNEENKNNSIIYKKIKVRNNSTECRNFNNKNNSITLNNSLLKDVEEKIQYYKNQEEKNNNLNNVEDKRDIPKLNTNVVSKQYTNIKKSFRNEKNDNNPSINDEKKTSKDRKFTKKNVYENQINEYKNKFKKSNVKVNGNKKGHLTTNSIYLRNITQKDIKIKAQKNNTKLNDAKKCYNKKEENSFEFVNAKKIYLTRRNSIIDRTIMNSCAKRETNVNSLKYSPKRNNRG
jgi:serine/threonine protein kinase